MDQAELLGCSGSTKIEHEWRISIFLMFKSPTPKTFKSSPGILSERRITFALPPERRGTIIGTKETLAQDATE